MSEPALPPDVVERLEAGELVEVGQGFAVGHGKCPLCACLDVWLNAPLPMSRAECWDCGCVYEMTVDGCKVVAAPDRAARRRARLRRASEGRP